MTVLFCDLVGSTRVRRGGGGPLPTSDVAHNPATLFHAAHEVLAAAWPEAVVVSLRSMRRRDGALVVVSDGSREKRPGDEAVGGRLRDLLRAGLGGGPAVVSCNDANDEHYPYPRLLCGLTDVQGRSLNGSPDVRGADAGRLSGRFVHLEQTRDVLGEFERGWGRWPEHPNLSAVLQAVTAVMPSPRRPARDKGQAAAGAGEEAG